MRPAFNPQLLGSPLIEDPEPRTWTRGQDAFTVAVHEHDCRQRVNPGFQNPQRPAWYLATQEMIVPKEPLFAQICDRLIGWYSGRRERLVIFEPGIGLGCFFRYLLTKTKLPELFQLHLIGADVAHEMILGCRDILAGVARRPSWKPVTVELHSRVNLLALEAPDVQQVLRGSRWDAVIASQFEHYFPNTSTSSLAQKLSCLGLPGSTKHAFRRYVCDHLQSEGCYFSLDDYLSGREADDTAHLWAWDSYVARALSDPARIHSLADRFPVIAAALARKYDPRLGLETLIQKVVRARERRRTICYEESAELNSSIADLCGIFGETNVTVAQHPLRQSHGQFYLLLARKRATG